MLSEAELIEIERRADAVAAGKNYDPQQVAADLRSFVALARVNAESLRVSDELVRKEMIDAADAFYALIEQPEKPMLEVMLAACRRVNTAINVWMSCAYCQAAAAKPHMLCADESCPCWRCSANRDRRTPA